MRHIAYTNYVIEEYGYECHASHKFATIVGDELFIGGKKVIGYSAEEFNNLIPCYYTVIYNDGTYTHLITTLDLTDQDKCWSTGIYFDTIEDCFAFIENYNKHESFDIHVEEPLLLT